MDSFRAKKKTSGAFWGMPLFKLPGSPYSSQICSLFFKGEGPVYIHRELLRASPKLDFEDDRIEFAHINMNVGHILVHFLLTGSYQYLELGRRSQIEGVDEHQTIVLDEFSTALGACRAAKDLELPALLNLAKERMEIAGNALKLTSVIQEIELLSPSPITVPEVAAYLSSRVEEIIKKPTRGAVKKLSAELGEPKTTSEVLLKCFIDSRMVWERVEEEKLPDEPTGDSVSALQDVEDGDRPTEECPVEERAGAEDDYAYLQKKSDEDILKEPRTEDYAADPTIEQHRDGPIQNESIVLTISPKKLKKEKKKEKKKMTKKAKIASVIVQQSQEILPSTPPLVGSNEESHESDDHS